MELVQEHTKTKVSAKTVKSFPVGLSFLHWHGNCEICVPQNKPAKFLVDGELIFAEPGDIIVFDEYITHQFIIDEPQTDIYIMHINLDCFSDQRIPFKPIRPHIHRTELEIIPGLSDRISYLFDVIQNEQAISADPKENPFLHSIAASLYYLLMRHFQDYGKASGSKPGRGEFYEIAEYINANYKDNITVNLLSEKLFMSRKKITAVFRRFSGIGIGEYVNTLRIKNVNLLLTRGLDISEAALESGFQSLRTFNDVYKKYMGITPTEYSQGISKSQ